MIEIGYNYRLSDLACALGESQMKRIEHFVARRRELASIYRELLSDVEEVLLPPDHPGHSYHLFPLRVSADIRKEVFGFLREAGIGVQVHYVPLHLHTYYREKFAFSKGAFPLAEAFSAGEISFPLFPDMKDGHVKFAVDKLKLAITLVCNGTPQ
jgi:dTDP-4-amino-4,6-dideoxygalactose transaminase